MALESGDSERWLGHKGGALISGITVLIEETQESFLASFSSCEAQWEGAMNLGS